MKNLVGMMKQRKDTQNNQLTIFDMVDPMKNDPVVMDLPLSWDSFFYTDAQDKDSHTDSISDALIKSLTTLGKVDIEYISSITGETYADVIRALNGSIYCNPEKWEGCFYKGWETSEEYLSGNLIRKLNIAEEANKTHNGQFDENIKAIKRVLPDAVPTKDIYVTLGSPWVPTDIIDDFITYILNLRGTPYTGTLHDEITGTWEIQYKGLFRHRVRAENTYGTPRISALNILEKTLNMKTVSVTDEAISNVNASGKTWVINKPETVLALEKQQKLIKDFQRWVWRDERRKERLEEIFESKYSCVRRRIFEAPSLIFPQCRQKSNSSHIKRTQLPESCLRPTRCLRTT